MRTHLFLWLTIYTVAGFAQSDVSLQELTFESEGVILAGTVITPKNPFAAVVLVHGSDPVKREMDFAKRVAKAGIAVFTYDKRGVGESGGVYVGPSVGTNNIDTTNLKLLARDVSAAVNTFGTYLNDKEMPVGLIGFSQAGWIIPLAAKINGGIDFMVLFSGPTITTLEQLRFQFYTNGNTEFWKNHSETDARYHTKNDPDRYQFVATDPVHDLSALEVPGLWLYGEKDIQVPVALCIEELDTLIAKGKPFEYVKFPDLGHNTAHDKDSTPFDISIQWIKRNTQKIKGKQKR